LSFFFVGEGVARRDFSGEAGRFKCRRFGDTTAFNLLFFGATRSSTMRFIGPYRSGCFLLMATRLPSSLLQTEHESSEQLEIDGVRAAFGKKHS
jgi:hypothetical protein